MMIIYIVPDLNVLFQPSDDIHVYIYIYRTDYIYLVLSASNVLFFYPPDWVNITGNILGHVDHPVALACSKPKKMPKLPAVGMYKRVYPWYRVVYLNKQVDLSRFGK